MGIFDLFKKNKKIEKINEIQSFFDFPRNDEGIKKVVEWLKESKEIILGLDEEGNLVLKRTEDGTIFLSAFTNLHQYSFSDENKGEKFATIDFEGLTKIFENHAEIDLLWLNILSDSVQINRSVFTPKRVIKENTEVQIGLPANQPLALIDFLTRYAEKNATINTIYLGLMRNQSEFSYAVFIESDSSKKIVAEIGPKINELCIENELFYPVDFMYENLLKDEQYIIYSK